CHLSSRAQREFAPDQKRQRGRNSDNGFITDFPDSNRFHRLLLFDCALRPQRARTITLWYGTPVGFGRATRPEVVPKKDHPGSLGVESSALTEPIRGIRSIREIRDELFVVLSVSVRAVVRACPEE